MDFSLLKETWKLRAFGFLKIPMIFYCSPKLLELSDEVVEMVIPLNYRTRNHLGSMYFGALAVGADVAGGLIAMRLIGKAGNSVNLIFKDFRAEFLKRPEADVHFRSSDGAKMKALVERTLATGERQNETVEIIATCPRKFGAEPVAKLYLTISLKTKSSK